MEAADKIEPQGSVVADFKAKTDELFHEISEMNPSEIEETVKCHVQAKIDESGIDAEIVDVAVTGSRCRGLERKGSDLDVVVELSTNEREDVLFDTFNEDGLSIGGIKVDINPITAQRTGTLETYLPNVEEYLDGVCEAREHEPISLFNIRMNDEERWYKNTSGLDAEELCRAYAECKLPFVEMGQYGERIDIGEFAQIQQGERLNFSIEFNLETDQITIFDGKMSEEMEARVWEIRMPDLTPAEQLAAEFDRFVYDYDRNQYHDSAQSMTENVSEIVETLGQRDTHDMAMWLTDVITEGTEPEETKRAMELLKKLAEYKPLAKIEELEENNYNMIDNVLNNGAGEKAQKEENRREQERPATRTSLKARLAEKKALASGQGKDHEAKENEKKNQREM